MTIDPKTQVRRLIDRFGLAPHPEGGYFKESYRSAELIVKSALPRRFKGDRSFSTAIYFLLPAGAKSRLHRIKSDELWHFYLGGPMRLVQLSEDGRLDEIVMGPDVAAGQKLQHAVLAGCWFGAYPEKGGAFSFVGCTVAPGFDFADFELAKRSELLKRFPQARQAIELLTG